MGPPPSPVHGLVQDGRYSDRRLTSLVGHVHRSFGFRPPIGIGAQRAAATRAANKAKREQRNAAAATAAAALEAELTAKRFRVAPAQPPSAFRVADRVTKPVVTIKPTFLEFKEPTRQDFVFRRIDKSFARQQLSRTQPPPHVAVVTTPPPRVV